MAWGKSYEREDRHGAGSKLLSNPSSTEADKRNAASALSQRVDKTGR